MEFLAAPASTLASAGHRGAVSLWDADDANALHDALASLSMVPWLSATAEPLARTSRSGWATRCPAELMEHDLGRNYLRTDDLSEDA